MLRLDGLSAGYGGAAVLRDFSLTVAPGEIVAALGPCGVGKTTLLRCLAGLLPAREGEIFLAGRRLTDESVAERVKRGLVLCPEGRQLFGSLSVGENLELGAMRRKVTRRQLRAEVEELSEWFPLLRERRKQEAGTLSGGEQQIVALARSWLARPSILLLDEPSLGLAPLPKREAFRLIALIASRGTGVLLADQDRAAAMCVARRAFELEPRPRPLTSTPEPPSPPVAALEAGADPIRSRL